MLGLIIASHRSNGNPAPLSTADAQDRGIDRALDLAKWIAVVAMATDHWGKIVAPEYFFPTHAIGRLAFPLFAWVIVVRLALQPRRVGNYLALLLGFALLSQPIYVYAGHAWPDGNILFTLAFGVAAAWFSDRTGMLRLVGLLVLFLAALTSDFAPLGAPAIVLLYRIARADPYAAAWATGPVGALVNLPVANSSESVFLAAACFASVVAVASLRVRAPLPRLPRWAFYGFYPLHIAVLLWVSNS